MKAFFSEPSLILPFELASHQGAIGVYYGANTDPCKAGFDSLPGLNIPLDMCVGYPIMHARIEDYAGAGYRMTCGWIQLITRETVQSANQSWENAAVSVSIDLFPAMEDLGSPFCAVGALPSIFDAPCRNLWAKQHALTWTADTFLVTVPLRSREEDITCLAGFRWGYREYASSTSKPVEILPAESTDAVAWNNHLDFLRGDFQSWRFK